MTTHEPFGCAIDRHWSMIRALSSRCYTTYHHQQTHICHQKLLLQPTSMEPSTTTSFFHPKRSQFATDGKQDRKNTRESGQHKPVGRTKASWACALVQAHTHTISTYFQPGSLEMCESSACTSPERTRTPSVALHTCTHACDVDSRIVPLLVTPPSKKATQQLSLFCANLTPPLSLNFHISGMLEIRVPPWNFPSSLVEWYLWQTMHS